MSDEEELDAIVVGAGPAGLSCAYTLASAGLEVIVLDRADSAGAKNVSGGRLYLEPVREMCNGFLKDAPFERAVVSERIMLMGENRSVSLRADRDTSSDREPHSVIVLRTPFDKHLADKVSDTGAMVLWQQRVDALLRDDHGRVTGVQVGPEKLRSKVVVAADGVLSFLSQESGLRPSRDPDAYAVGIKEVIKLDAASIEDRFGLSDGQGASCLMIGELSDGLPAGGFLYTNRDSISIGMVVHIDALRKWQGEKTLCGLLEDLKNRSELARLLVGAETVEYSAHLIPEGGFRHLPPSGMPGLLLVGDAAGFVLNTGLTVRGMDFAIASGVLAARSIIETHKEGKPIEHIHQLYKSKLKNSFVINQLKAHRRSHDLLKLKRLYKHYPQETARLAQSIFEVNRDGESISIGKALKWFGRDVAGLKGIRDLLRLLRM